MISSNFTLRLIAIALLLLTGIAHAQEPAEYELHLVPGVPVAPLDLVARGLAPSQTSYTVTVETEPALGELVGEDYFPTTEFWAAGADLFTLGITPAGGTLSLHTFLLAPTTSTQTQYAFEDFDDNTIPATWASVGSSFGTVADPGGMGYRLMTTFYGTGSSHIGDSLSLPDISQEGDGVHAVGVSGDTIPGPPPGDFTGSGFFNFFFGGPDDDPANAEIFLQQRITLDAQQNPVHEMRASTSPSSGPCAGCATEWRVVQPNEEVGFRVWTGPTVINPNANEDLKAPALRFDLIHQNAADNTSDWLLGDFDISITQYGYYQATGLSFYEMSYDEVRSWADYFDLSPRTVFFEDFEGIAAAGSLVGPISVVNAGDMEGSFYASADVAALDTGSPRDALIQSYDPSDETGVTAHMSIDTTHLNLENGESLRLFAGSAHSTTLDTFMHLEIVLKRQSGTYKVWAKARGNAAGDNNPTFSYGISEGKHRLVLRWHSAGQNAGGGSVALWVDGVLTGEVSGFINDDPAKRDLQIVAFGAFNPTLNLGGSAGQELRIDDLWLARHKPGQQGGNT